MWSRDKSGALSLAWVVVDLVFFSTIAIGWVLNIINFVRALPVFDTINIFRAIGIVIAPLGALLGWFV